jgi:hypothetical protein
MRQVIYDYSWHFEGFYPGKLDIFIRTKISWAKKIMINYQLPITHAAAFHLGNRPPGPGLEHTREVSSNWAWSG